MSALIHGLASGLLIALMAVAFQLVHLSTRVFYMAQAGLFALCPYLFVYSSNVGLPKILAIGVALGVTTTLSLLLEVVIHRRLARLDAAPGVHLISSLGAYVVIVEFIAAVWGDQARTLRAGIIEGIHFDWGIVAYPQAVVLTCGATLIIAFFGVMRSSPVALNLRALADSPAQFALYGHDVRHYRLVAFGACGAMTGAVSLLAAYEGGFDPHAGMNIFLLSVVAVIVGGRLSFFAAIAGGLLLGLARSQILWSVSAKWQDAATFALLVLVLLLRPEGLFARRGRLDAQSM